MIFGRRITFTHGGASTAPERTAWKLTAGMIYQLEVSFPPGCAGLVSVRIADHAGQLYPYDIGEWFSGDGQTISFPETHSLEVEPYELLLEGYNEDESYDHTVSFRVGFVTRDIFIARFLPSVGAVEMSKVLEALSATAEQKRLEEAAALLASGKALLGIGAETEGEAP